MYGGVAIAGVVGTYFYRHHDDVDVYVIERALTGRLSAPRLLRGTFSGGISRTPSSEERRRKFEVSVDKAKRLSVVPLFPTMNRFELRYPLGNFALDQTATERCKRTLGEFAFITPPRNVIATIVTAFWRKQPMAFREGKKRRDDANRPVVSRGDVAPG